ncbi:MAG: SMI1/KNR4 family protein [Planctomycetota bacterium]
MDPALHRELELICDASLPDAYLTLMSSFPKSLKACERAGRGDSSAGYVSQVELLSDPVDVIAINREVRYESIPDPDGNEFRWPDQLLVIGETGEGDYYCIDVDGEHTGVLQFRHQEVDFEILTDSIDEFVELLVNAFHRGNDE